MKFTIYASLFFAFAASASASPMEARQEVEHCRLTPEDVCSDPLATCCGPFIIGVGGTCTVLPEGFSCTL
ncbi:hypothetical protein BKA70DRAFT_1424954 [Coprinopsis sp. MPI-PUGE-AT-0042]|nr:hypothetical protein BKA70DRAFT_1424954 [Coprinopsis sp. MPI-PUGE-AT-0042]